MRTTGMAKRMPRRTFKRPFLDHETSSIGTGPLNFEVVVARAHGWTDEEIERAYKAMARIVRRGWDAAQARHPELYRRHRDSDDIIFIGPIGKPESADYRGPLNLDPKDYVPIAGRKTGKPDRRSNTDRRATKRRVGDKLAAKLREGKRR